jgi:hypothetical protein
MATITGMATIITNITIIITTITSTTEE